MDSPAQTSPNFVQGSRISQTAFTAVIFAALALAVLAVTTKIALRFRWAGRLSLDDGVLVASLVFLAASVALIYHSLEYIYSIFRPGAQFDADVFLEFSRLVDASAVLSWTTIFLVKMSFVAFFYPLTDRLHRLRVLWWVVCVLVVPCGLINVFMTFHICDRFTRDSIAVCGAGIEARLTAYVIVTAALDIISDACILSIPITLLWGVQIDLRRKLGLAAVLCLSAIMIAIQIVRASLGFIYMPMPVGPPGRQAIVTVKQIDQSWMFFWLSVEATVAIIMVSVAAFRSMLGRRSSSSSYGGSSGRATSGTAGSSGEHGAPQASSSKFTPTLHSQSSWVGHGGHPHPNVELDPLHPPQHQFVEHRFV